MSGVIDDQGRQWERCNECGRFIRIDRLGYEAGHPHGRDICLNCVVKGVEAGTIDIDHIIPAASWIAVYEEEVKTSR